MAQLKMYWFPDTPIFEGSLPEGYSFSKYKTEADKLAWVACCKQGLAADDATEKAFDDSILGWKDIDPFNDVFFLDHNGEHVGTITAFKFLDRNAGDVHMVAVRTDHRGLGLSKYMLSAALKHLKSKGVAWAQLTTDEWRKSAVKSYLTAGFLPVEYDEGMVPRWEAVLEEYGIDSVQMVTEDGKPFCVVTRSSLKAK